jgi:hypothetical protein
MQLQLIIEVDKVDRVDKVTKSGKLNKVVENSTWGVSQPVPTSRDLPFHVLRTADCRFTIAGL